MTPREAAYKTIVQNEIKRDFSNSFVYHLNTIADEKDKRFYAQMVKGIIRYSGRYDYLIKRFTKRKPQIEAVALLKIGLHQLTAMDSVPDYAAINETVSLTQKVQNKRLAPFVNAVLQNIRREIESMDNGLIALFPDPKHETVDYISSWHSCPKWLVKKWMDRFSVEDCEALCEHNNNPSSLTVHTKPGFNTAKFCDWLDENKLDYREVDSAVIIDQNPGRKLIDKMLHLFPEIIVQDLSVQAAVDYLAQHATGRILDMCAAPGGKTINLVWRTDDKSEIVAMDLSATRNIKTIENLNRVGINTVPLITADGLSMPFSPNSFDTILLDGPCTGTGVIRHHPEGRWELSESKIVRSGKLLLKLAASAVELLRPGGKLLYATCSLEPEENELVINKLVEGDARLSLAESGKYWLPHKTGNDGFFSAVVVRNS